MVKLRNIFTNRFFLKLISEAKTTKKYESNKEKVNQIKKSIIKKF